MLTNPAFPRASFRFASIAALGCLLASACSSGDGSTGTAGHGGTTGGAGTTGSGGTTGSSGTTGTGGTTGTSGTTGSGGTTGTSGTTGSGGTSGTVGTGGTTGSGGTTGAAGSSAGTGGQAGSAGGVSGSGNAGSTGGGGNGTNCGGHALSLPAADSSKGRAEVDLMGDLPTGAANRTIELWAYMHTTDWQANINTLFFYGKIPSARNADGFGLDFGSNMGTTGTIDPFTNAIFDNDNQSSGVNTSTAQWVHFAMTWDGTAVRAYVNGVLRSTKMGSAGQKLMTGASPITIGGYPGESAYFNSLIDEFRVWNVARSASDITSTMNKTLTGMEAGLVGYWKFDEPSGMTVADSVTATPHTGHSAMLMGGATLVAPNPPAPLSCP